MSAAGQRFLPPLALRKEDSFVETTPTLGRGLRLNSCQCLGGIWSAHCYFRRFVLAAADFAAARVRESGHVAAECEHRRRPTRAVAVPGRCGGGRLFDATPARHRGRVEVDIDPLLAAAYRQPPMSRCSRHLLEMPIDCMTRPPRPGRSIPNRRQFT